MTVAAPIPRYLRFREFIRRLKAAPPATNHDQARRLIDDTLNGVEDELSGVPFNPANWRTDGRMYPVQDDNIGDVPGFPRVTSYRSRRHETYIADNGAFEIRHIETEQVEVQKLGSDGKGVWK